MPNAFPHQVQVMITERCNLKCVHCAVPEEDSPASHELSRSEWEELVDRLAARGLPSLVFSGGEALLRPEAIALLRRALEKGVGQTTIVANMSVMSERIVRELVDAQQASPNFQLQVSIDGASGETHDWMRGEGQFERLIANAARLAAAGCRITGVNSMLHRGNLHELDAVADLARSLGAQNLRLFPIAALGRGIDLQQHVLNTTEWCSVLARLPQLSEQTGLDIMAMGPILEEFHPAVPAPNPNAGLTDRLLVGPDGGVFLCPPTRQIALGHARDAQDESSWSQVVERARRLAERSCAECSFLMLCVGASQREPMRVQGARKFSAPTPLVQLRQ